MDRSAITAEFASLTNCSDAEAAFYLEAANYDLDRAVSMCYGECCLRLSSKNAHMPHNMRYICVVCIIKPAKLCLVQIKSHLACSIEPQHQLLQGFLKRLPLLKQLRTELDVRGQVSFRDWSACHLWQ